jgi:hypothetical protein
MLESAVPTQIEKAGMERKIAPNTGSSTLIANNG